MCGLPILDILHVIICVASDFVMCASGSVNYLLGIFSTILMDLQEMEWHTRKQNVVKP